MAGVLYNYANYAGTDFLVRTAKLYDPSLYWYRVSSEERHGIGIVALGRGSGNGQDILMPSCDWERDICVYGSGGSYFRDSACPKVSFNANGVPSISGDMALFNHNNMGDYIAPPLGKYCATTKRYTDKLRARDYNTYDSQLHRDVGVSGMVNSDTAWTGRYNDTPHGSLFYFDIPNNRALTFMSLVACRNMFVADLYVRKMSSDPREEPYWSNFGFKEFPDTSGPTYYVPTSSAPNSRYPMRKVMRSLGATVSIDGNDHLLYQVYGEFPGTDYIGWNYVEGPWYKVSPQDGVASSMYVLEEWVTIHKPD